MKSGNKMGKILVLSGKADALLSIVKFQLNGKAMQQHGFGLGGKSGVVRIRDNFGERKPIWSVKEVHETNDDYKVTLKKGQSVEVFLQSVPKFLLLQQMLQNRVE